MIDQDLPGGITHSKDDDGNDLYQIPISLMNQLCRKHGIYGVTLDDVEGMIKQTPLLRILYKKMRPVTESIRVYKGAYIIDRYELLVAKDDESAVIMTLLDIPCVSLNEWSQIMEEINSLRVGEE